MAAQPNPTSYNLTVVISLLWVAATLPILAATKIAAFRNLMLCLSGRGKIFLESSSNINLSVPQKLFWHFYVVGVVWTTFLLLTTGLYAHQFQILPEASDPHGVWKSVLLLLLMEAQVLRRLFESLYVFKYSPSARLHLVGYLTGIFYYVGAPLSLCSMHSMEVLKFVVVGGAEIREFDLWRVVKAFMGLHWYVWAGAGVFVWGWVHQRRCHAILGSLRNSNEKINSYAIPRGDWFEYVSSPHYLAEIVMYIGLVIASGLSDITVWSLFGFVAVNLTFSAFGTHRWYLRKFDNYPKNRFAIIPFVC